MYPGYVQAFAANYVPEPVWYPAGYSNDDLWINDAGATVGWNGGPATPPFIFKDGIARKTFSLIYTAPGLAETAGTISGNLLGSMDGANWFTMPNGGISVTTDFKFIQIKSCPVVMINIGYSVMAAGIYSIRVLYNGG